MNDSGATTTAGRITGFLGYFLKNYRVTFLLILGLKRKLPAIPGVLVAVVLTTLISALISYENKTSVDASQIQDGKTKAEISAYEATDKRINELTDQIAMLNQEANDLEEKGGLENVEKAAGLRASVAVYEHELKILKKENTLRRLELHKMTLQGAKAGDGQWNFYSQDSLPPEFRTDGKTWRFDGADGERIVLTSGGAVVGTIPDGLPAFQVPTMQWDLILSLLPAALVMALIGFMEATSISKAIASTTGERVDTSKELVGQGLANIAGSFFGSYTLSLIHISEPTRPY